MSKKENSALVISDIQTAIDQGADRVVVKKVDVEGLWMIFACNDKGINYGYTVGEDNCFCLLQVFDFCRGKRVPVFVNQDTQKCKACFADGLLLLEKELPAFKEALGNLLFQLNPEIWEIAQEEDKWLEQPPRSREEVWDEIWQVLEAGKSMDFHIGNASRGTDRGTVYICPITPETNASGAWFFPALSQSLTVKEYQKAAIYGYVLEVEWQDFGGYHFQSEYIKNYDYRSPKDMLAEFQRKYRDCLPKDFPYKERMGRYYFTRFA